MARLLVLLTILTACGTNNDGAGANQQAAFVFTDVYSTLESVQARALSAQPVAPVVQTVDYSGPCTMGGTIAMHGTYDGDGTTNATYMFDVSMAACAETGSTIDGSMTWDGVVSGTQANPVYSET